MEGILVYMHTCITRVNNSKWSLPIAASYLNGRSRSKLQEVKKMRMGRKKRLWFKACFNKWSFKCTVANCMQVVNITLVRILKIRIETESQTPLISLYVIDMYIHACVCVCGFGFVYVASLIQVKSSATFCLQGSSAGGYHQKGAAYPPGRAHHQTKY